jgi:cyanobactin maturation PatA/PatG family protease
MGTPQETAPSALPELAFLDQKSLGSSEICVAILDGPVDLEHPCFQGANLVLLDTLVSGAVRGGPMSRHGTHVTSVIFGQPGGPVLGVAPHCRGLILPVFSDDGEGRVSQLDLARAIERAVQEGAHIINISGGEPSLKGQATDILVRAVRHCETNNVLVVAAVGNDGCECLNVPAALSGVLAVGALAKNGHPLNVSNWGQVYRTNGILAPGEDILGAVPGGTALFTGSSFAAPIVSGVAALLLTSQRKNGNPIDPSAAREAILSSALPCDPLKTQDCPRFLAGTLNITGAYALLVTEGKQTMANSGATLTPRAGEHDVAPAEITAFADSQATIEPAAVASSLQRAPANSIAEFAAPAPSTGPGMIPQAGGVVPAAACGCGTKISNVFALGIIGFDFGTEARRDSFQQLMSASSYDIAQLCNYLDANPSECAQLIWTLNLDATPIYAIQPEVPYSEDVYKLLRSILRGESLKQEDVDYVGRVSVPGVLTSKTVRLFSGQTVPVVVAPRRGFYAWNESALLKAVRDAIPKPPKGTDPGTVDMYLRNFLHKVYFEFRNLGQTSADRALNYSATNLFQLGAALAKIINPKELIPNIAEGTLYAFDSISVSKSPYCRVDSDCWDVQLVFFNPDNDQTANLVAQFTVDVSDTMPVTLASARLWTTKPN